MPVGPGPGTEKPIGVIWRPVKDTDTCYLNLSPEFKVAWLDHELVRIYPVQDGSGSVFRLLVACAYATASEFPQRITTTKKEDDVESKIG